MRALKKALRTSTKLDADRAARDDLFRQVQSQLYDWEASGAFRRFVDAGDATALAQFRAQLDAKLSTERLGVDHDAVIAEIVAILEQNLGQAQRFPEAATDAQAAFDRQHTSAVGEDIKAEVGAGTDRILEALEKAGIDKPEPPARLLKVDRAPEGARKALVALGEAHADELTRLQAEVGEPADLDRAVAVVDEWPVWVSNGSLELLCGLARLIEQSGEWSRSSLLWERAALLADGRERAGLFVRAAVAAEIGSELDRKALLLERARKIAPDHPRLILEEINEDDSFEEQLEALDRVHTDDPELAALAALQRSIAYLLQPDIRAARKQIEDAERLAPGMIQVKLCRINVVIQEARIAVSEDRPYGGPDLENAATQAGELRRELLSQRRFEESGRMLMLQVDALILSAQAAATPALFDSIVDQELDVPGGAEVLADAAIRANRPRDARRFIQHASPDTPSVERIRLFAIALSGSSEEVVDARDRLEELARIGEGGDSVPAAGCLALLAVDKPQLGWSESAEQTLAADGKIRLSVGAKAMYLARRGDPYGAMELLEPHAEKRWALEVMVRVAKIWGPGPRRAEAANRLLARGPDQAMQLECGQALAAGGRFDRAREVLVRLAGDGSAPRSIRSLAFHFSLLVVARDLDEWEQADALLAEWIEALPGDPEISSWQPAIANHRRRPS
jgi:tetratricopeptide (TPR) repeat protein